MRYRYTKIVYIVASLLLVNCTSMLVLMFMNPDKRPIVNTLLTISQVSYLFIMPIYIFLIIIPVKKKTNKE